MSAATHGELPLFAAARATDPETSHKAAEKARKLSTALHAAVLEAFRDAWPYSLNDRELEQLPQFAHYGPSTVRKRRSELYQAGALVAAGERNGLTTWTINAARQP